MRELFWRIISLAAPAGIVASFTIAALLGNVSAMLGWGLAFMYYCIVYLEGDL
jgi:hypothetical protein